MKRSREDTLEFFLGLEWERDGVNCSAQTETGQYLFYLDADVLWYNHWGEDGVENIDEDMDYDIELAPHEMDKLHNHCCDVEEPLKLYVWNLNNPTIYPLDVEAIMDNFIDNLTIRDVAIYEFLVEYYRFMEICMIDIVQLPRRCNHPSYHCCENCFG